FFKNWENSSLPSKGGQQQKTTQGIQAGRRSGTCSACRLGCCRISARFAEVSRTYTTHLCFLFSSHSNPPLSEEMLPPGEWMCHRCTVRRKKREQKKELGHMNGLVDKSGKRTSSPTSDADYLDRAGGGSLRTLPHARLLERRASRPGTPTSNTSTDTPNSEQIDVDEDIIDVDDDSAPGAEAEGGQPHLKRPFELLIAAAMERNPTQFQLPNELTCTTALPGEGAPCKGLWRGSWVGCCLASTIAPGSGTWARWLSQAGQSL
ncbi:PREDICTED: PHD finger protein 12-like, partial [Thamnophis sirtalis]|uniref:PHD finger protein 12-like n=1 Tax=Thamnophis sirtalis TaxID=35019 RepID=A0A6I9Z785_9SAUR